MANVKDGGHVTAGESPMFQPPVLHSSLYDDDALAKLKDLRARAASADIRSHIENLASAYSALMPMCKDDEIIALFSAREDVRAEMPWGIYDGPEGIRRLYTKSFPAHDAIERRTNEQHLQPVYSLVVEVAEDEQTARALWMSTGIRMGKTADETTEDYLKWKHVKAYWSGETYAADFIFENGEWKFWHLHVYNIYLTDYYISYAKPESGQETNAVRPPFLSYIKTTGDAAPDRPASSEWHYDKNAVFAAGQPSVPEAYKTFADVGSGY